jgi:putative lipoic acid-binding regulatory protein
MAGEDPRSLIEYPSLFPIKVMGAQHPDFTQAVVDIVLRFDPGYDRGTLEERPSRGGNYLGLTLHITATSREQLDELYRALSSHPLVKVVL